MNHNSIQIIKVANGWIVVMPMQNNPGIPGMGNINFAEIAKNMKGAMEQDDMVKNLQDKAIAAATPVIPTDELIHIFPTFPEVLGFLKFTIQEPEKNKPAK